MLCTHFSFLNAGMLFTLFLSCMQVYFSPYSIPPNDGWQCDSNSAQEKELHSDVVASAFQCFSCCKFICLCSLAFFERAFFALRLRYALPFMARFLATHDG